MSDDLTRPFDAPPVEPASTTMAAAPPPPLERLSSGLIAYGIIGLVVAVISLGVLLYVNGRIDAAGERVETTVAELATTMDRTAKVLHYASTTAQSFSNVTRSIFPTVSSSARTS